MDWLEDPIFLSPNLDYPYPYPYPYTFPENIAADDWWPLPHHHQLPSPPISTTPTITPKKRKAQSNPPRRKPPAAANNEKRESRWAEQLLNPLSAAIQSGNASRSQHLLYVLQELASPTGDPNQRLAFYGLQSLTRAAPAAAEPKGFRSALIKFNEVSPWYAFPNFVGNAAIVGGTRGGSAVHVVDAGVSHGVQWPTMLEAMSRRPGGPPEAVRITVVGGTEGCDYGPALMRYARSIGVELKVEKEGRRGRGEEEMVVVCGKVGEGFFRAVREMEPDLVVLSEEEELGLGFGKRVERMWRFLESTGAAFKGKESEERRLVEREGARVLEEGGREGGGGGKEKMEGLGFREEEFGEEVVEAGKALLKKYDGGWEMSCGRGGVGLWWKGQPVSFCSLWKPLRNRSTVTAGFGTNCMRRF